MNSRIAQLAEELRLTNNQLSYPIDVKAIALNSGATIIDEDFNEEMSGFSYQKDGKRIIGLNTSESPNRKRFTIAHELGHLFLHSSDSVNYEKGILLFRDGHSSDGTDAKEREANRFAAELLMPEKLLREEMKHAGKIDLLDENSQSFINSLAAKFEVSPQAMSVRLATLSNF